MIRYLFIVFFLLIGYNVIAQTRPSGFPTQFNTGWARWGYLQGDSGVIWRPRDTSAFLPRFTGTVVLDPTTRRPYMYDSTELRWYKLLVSGEGGDGGIHSVTGDFGLFNINDSTLRADTTRGSGIPSYFYTDSLGATKLNISDTSSMLTPYLNSTGFGIFRDNQFIRGDTTRSTGLPSYYYVDSLAGTITSPTPTLQQVTDVGFTTTNPIVADSVKARIVQPDSSLLLPLRDTLAAAVRQGEIRYDTLTGSIVYNNGIWNYIQSIVGNRPDIQLAAGVIRGLYNSGSGTTDWDFIVNPIHDSLFFTGISVVGSTLEIEYDSVEQVITFIAVPDETLAPYVTMGASVGVDKAVLSLFQLRGSQGGLFRGNGTTYPLDSRMSNWTVSFTAATGTLLFTPNVLNSGFTESTAIQCNYDGTNQYRIERLFSALGGHTWGFQIVDGFGNPVTDLPTTADAIQVSTEIPLNSSLSPGGGGTVQQALFAGNSNIWLFAVFKRKQ